MTGFNTVCDWPVVYPTGLSCSALSVPEEDTEGYDAAVANKAAFESMAVEFLWRWTGRQFGVCEVVSRPLRMPCKRPSTFVGRGPYTALGTGRYPALPEACRLGRCMCSSAKVLDLNAPVNSVTSIVIDGETLDPSKYRLDEGRYLLRLDGRPWPTAQDLYLPTTEEGTWQVTYERGVPVPDGGQVAAGVLACELAKASVRDTSCALPQRIQSITRQGVTMAILDAFDDIDSGHTGIWLIDSWVASITKSPKPSRVFSPDVPRGPGARRMP